MTRRILLASAAAAALLTQTRAASAQMSFIGGVSSSWAPAISPATGIQIGDGVILHTGVGVEGGYDSNVFYNDDTKVGATLVRVTPFIDINNATRTGEVPSGIAYDLNATLTYREYFSDQEDVTRLRAFVPTVRGSLGHTNGGTLTESVTEGYTRAEDAPYYRGTSQQLIIRNNNVASAQLGWAPGGGRLQSVLRYTNTLDIFETDSLKSANSLGHEALLDVSWRWLPKTALYLQLRQGYISYLNADTQAELGDKSSSYPLRAVLGVRGLITEKTSVAVGFGYQNDFYSNGATTSGFLGSTTVAAELVVLPLMFTRVVLGGRHDFQNSVIGNFFYDDGVYASLSQQTVAKLVGQVWVSYDHRRFYGLHDAPDPRVDNLVQAGAIFDYYLKNWAYAGLSYTLALNRSDYKPMDMTLSGATYTKQQIFARVGITY